MEKKETVNQTNQKKAHNEMNDMGNIDKVRDILFGSQVKDIEKRMNRLKDDLTNGISTLRDETMNKFESLENYMKKELDDLTDQLTSQQDKLNKSVRELRQEILDQSNKLTDEIRKKTEETVNLVEQRTNELREDKVDRTTLAELFSEMAVRLSDDLASKINPE